MLMVSLSKLRLDGKSQLKLNTVTTDLQNNKVREKYLRISQTRSLLLKIEGKIQEQRERPKSKSENQSHPRKDLECYNCRKKGQFKVQGENRGRCYRIKRKVINVRSKFTSQSQLRKNLECYNSRKDHSAKLYKAPKN